ncbi:MAG TPA: glycosyltransferase [Nakamurella sp.]|nr:glycosyltransferase [Nakamurella sp.]
MRRHPRVGVLIEGLRAAGDDVVEVNAPLDLDTAARVRLLREPWRIPLAAGSLAACWVRLIRGARRTAPPDAVLVGYLGQLDVWLARLLFPRTPIALDHLVSLGGTAWDRGLASGGGMKRRILDAVDRGALRRADVAIVDTPENAPAIRTGSGDAVVVPVGAAGLVRRPGVTPDRPRTAPRCGSCSSACSRRCREPSPSDARWPS